MDKIVVIVLVAVLVFSAVFLLLRNSRAVTYVTADEVEAKPSTYRTEEVTALMTIIEYWLSDIIPEDTHPHVYSNDDYTISYINYGTIKGLLRCALNWNRNTLELHYSKHDEAEGECKELRRVMRRDNDKAIVDFLLETKDLELSLAADTAELLANLQNFATSPAAIEEMKDRSTGSVLIALCVFLTSYLMRQKRPSNILTTLYKHLSMLLFQRYDEEMKEFLQEHLPPAEAEPEADKSSPSE